MTRACVAALLHLGLATCFAVPARSQPTTTDKELATGIQEWRDGDFEAALVTLNRAAQRLSSNASRAKELAQARLYLGFTYVGLDLPDAAKASFREALGLDPQIRVEAAEHSAKIVRAFLDALQDARAGKGNDAPTAPAPTAASAPPDARAFSVRSEFLEKGEPGQAGLGVRTRGLSRALRRRLRLPDLEGGVVVTSVYEGTPAFVAGVHGQDIIRKVDGQIVATEPDILDLEQRLSVGQQVRLEVWRNGNSREIAVKLLNAVTFLRERCDSGVSRACTDLGARYYHGQGVTKDQARASPLYQHGCDGGDGRGCLNLAVLYAESFGQDKVAARLAELFKKACDGGEPYGCYNLGALYHNGNGVTKDEAGAATLYGQGCDGGAAAGCALLGSMYEDGRGGVVRDITRAHELYQEGCDGGAGRGCSSLGVNYFFGVGVPKDDERGITLLRKGCSNGDQWGCDQLKKLGKTP